MLLDHRFTPLKADHTHVVGLNTVSQSRKLLMHYRADIHKHPPIYESMYISRDFLSVGIKLYSSSYYVP